MDEQIDEFLCDRCQKGMRRYFDNDHGFNIRRYGICRVCKTKDELKHEEIEKENRRIERRYEKEMEMMRR